ncbi:MAG: DUF3253 domain-containing protein [Sphingomonadaceae bacterium]|uniref:DUF3253 domain-containing protein n=1 Tax=Thermaurantiacus sp. TaxID=2820283 RepID=UPI00298F1CAE|nr:DUF3253 domain-containing protein [Thermaurantiacus sp.]MCS6987847.1 DUF3253 domain-containing protein [Sphingomonadaceae bacterium]MDW8414933.1 DUF3253 domain-containing protein [Thermaurantiacus sp.]
MTAEEAIREALARRRPGGSICPTDAARLLGGADWRGQLPAIHAAARALAAAGEVCLTQRGEPVTDPRGAYRIGRAPPPDGA